MARDSSLQHPKPRRRSDHRERSQGARARKVLDRPPAIEGWDTSDEQEFELRRWRGRTEIVAVETLEPDQPVFGTFRARSTSGRAYEVEVRDLEGLANACGCIDHRTNGLGTCKHIEGVIAGLRRRGVRAFGEAAARGSPRVEFYLRRAGEPAPVLRWPREEDERTATVRSWLAPWLNGSGELRAGPDEVASVIQAYPQASDEVRRCLRISRCFGPWLERRRSERARRAAREAFKAELERDPGAGDILKHPLLTYQREGMIHLAFGERALLADEMGLGKTVQAIAACELLARRKGISRVLVVCPASLKAEWEEQVAKFTDRSVASVFGPRPARLAAYRDPPFFTIVNYEQVLGDAGAINELLAPDVVVLDEAQRIKNWRTKTAHEVKSLRSPYAFVLTGTPIENRIDELYSIVQYLDPELVGPLFRFNRSFYELDERGRPIDYRNLGELRRRVQPVLLRRRKTDVESELPGRTVKTFFVPMAEEQVLRYREFEGDAARLAALAQRRPLTQEEFDRLQMLLACMRMICDTPAILDPSCRVSPKLEELERILQDLLAEPDRKIIVFSEWERMLGLVRELAVELGVEAAWHTGSVPQPRRREEINRFKQDPACRLFLSTDSGSVGLNLQAASAVINVDQPWNPAKLEQRIARAWRKHQTRSVSVVNLISQGTIEHNIMHLLESKQALADGLLDGDGDLAALKMPSGRGALVERMRAMLEGAEALGPRIVPPEETLTAELRRRHGGRALRIEARCAPGGQVRVLAVLDLDEAAIAAETEQLRAEGCVVPVEIIGRDAWLALRRLMCAGVVGMTGAESRLLHAESGFADAPAPPEARAAEWREEAERAIRMAGALAVGGIPEEAPPLLAKALRCVAAARRQANGDGAADPALAEPEQLRAAPGADVHGLVTLLAAVRPDAAPPTPDAAVELTQAAARMLAAWWPSGDVSIADAQAPPAARVA
ncbi:MAG TPA: DEAD/DEAH box helicase [Caulobacteraceae bacterium]|nr:DEAD/DEAH box helicase [Caulobacteraceae bacterium]